MIPLTVSTADRQVKKTNNDNEPSANSSRLKSWLAATTTVEISVNNNATADVFRPFLLRKKNKQATTKPRAKNMLSCSTAIELLILRVESRIV